MSLFLNATPNGSLPKPYRIFSFSFCNVNMVMTVLALVIYALMTDKEV